ncbi:MAG: 16S rRNA (guanine(966)-N(2))-methyltransferase RsmD [Oscillospiraceae bacterium]|jgi:16S rRNA (guanine(966)-N(2))-methyltransferase RsmD|nr:16S rRNA (guanine(966)-N(2))-methyltransferase RsmD [Oscillospiraceae bacterium]
MRIIGGSAKGRSLSAPPGLATRPTQDAVRESLFNILARHVPGARVLDLFAGSGALGLESVSRGAALAVLVDRAPAAMAVIRGNVARLGFGDRCQCLLCDWRQALTRLDRQGAVFDLVFIDPPYDLVAAGSVCEALTVHGLLAPNALLAVEHRWGAPPQTIPPLHCADTRRYGGTGITFVHREADDAAGDFSGQF